MASSNPGSRIPPGGKSSIIFDSQPNQPRKVRDTQKSSIFGSDQPDNVKRNFLSPRPPENTKQRLFGEGESQVDASPRRVNDTWRSNVFSKSASADFLSDEVKRTPKRSPSSGLNPITGEPLSIAELQENGTINLETNGIGNGTTHEIDTAINGKVNGDNGHNGHENMKNGDAVEKVKSSRQPPGGKSNGIFD